MDHAGFEALIAGLGTGDKNTALEVRIFLTNLIQSIFLPGDIKPVYCLQEEIDSDYDETGLGRGKRTGWARCNGLNGTPTIAGRTIIGHGDEYPNIGTILGSKTHTLTEAEIPSVEVPFTGSNDDNGDPGDYLLTSPSESNGIRKLHTAGGGQSHSIMQPSVVLLYIQKVEI